VPMQSTTDCIVPYKKKQQSGIFMDGDSKTILNCFARSVSIPKRFQNDFSIPNRFQNHFHYLLLLRLALRDLFLNRIDVPQLRRWLLPLWFRVSVVLSPKHVCKWLDLPAVLGSLLELHRFICALHVLLHRQRPLPRHLLLYLPSWLVCRLLVDLCALLVSLLWLQLSGHHVHQLRAQLQPLHRHVLQRRPRPVQQHVLLLLSRALLCQ